ncbi:flagellar biosynthesis protein FlhF [Marispirochaeta sp.]|uniref:flagellar biosynthesis protein FlhF n=1 Tax=Marispirochaeta sp. TaxID=2038653 RepID=UPI0029C63751|nr:flagellar biosynthesis protein FlhF [Marispirochaeta sp.]
MKKANGTALPVLSAGRVEPEDASPMATVKRGVGMEYFTERAASHREVLQKIRDQYGERARVLTQRSVRIGGFLGMFAREGIEVTGYIAKDAPKPRKMLDPEEERKKILESVKGNGDGTLQQVLKAVNAIQERLDTPEPKKTEEIHPSIVAMEQLLEENEFSPGFIREISNRLRREMSLEDLDRQDIVESSVFQWIGEKIAIYEPRKTPKIMILIGPTGVGKTTTIAKLAAIYGLGHNGSNPVDVRMITIDNYRIGAKQQIDTYGSIMNIPVSGVESFQDLKKTLALFEGSDLILIDTIGKSPRDYMKLAEMREMLDACGHDAEVFLTMSSTTKVSDIKDLLKTFEPFGYQAIILTKLDETQRVGNVISVITEYNKPVAFLTDGQSVPQDIHEASIPRLLMNLDGFKAAKMSLRPQEGRATGDRSGAEYVKNGVWE